ncbi:MAG TPA: hypothetical protein PLR08_00425 [bacterium]|nr:hypothetical protein [bacterium]
MPAGSHTLTTTVSASEFLQLALKNIGNHQQDTYEDEFVLREPTNLGGERGDRFRHRVTLKGSWQYKKYRIAFITEEVKHNHRSEEWRPCYKVSALLFEMPRDTGLDGSLFTQAIIYPKEDWRKDQPCSWENELFHITHDKNGVITCNKGSEHPLFYEAVRDCLHPRDSMDFSPLRYEADKTRLFVDALKALAKDRIKQVTATPPVSAQPVSVNN